jgi:single-strand DNA-binding protein
MADVNHVVLVGRLTRNAELKYTNNGSPVSKFSIAINQRRKKDDQWTDEAHFFDIVLWGKSAESLNPYLVKGKQVGIEGQLRQNRWEQEGQSRSKVEIFATNVMLLGGKGAAAPAEAPQGQEPKEFPEGSPPPADNFEDDIPF